MSGELKVGGSSLISDSGGTGALTWGANVPSGTVTNVKVLSNNTRTAVALSALADREILYFGDYNKLRADTDLLLSFTLSADKGDNNYVVPIGMKYGTSATTWTGGRQWASNASSQMFFSGQFYITGHTTTGAQSCSVRSGSADGSSITPCDYINPNSSDHAAYHQMQALCFCMEVMP